MVHLYNSNPMQNATAAGVPLAGAKLYFYQTGTTTSITTYQDSAKATPHADPVVASASGLFAPIYVEESTYKVVLKDSDDVTIQTIDPVYSQRGDAGGNIVADDLESGLKAQAVGFETVADLLADTDDYTTHTAGDILWAEGYSFKVQASGASDEHLTTAGGAKLKVRKRNNIWPMLAFNPDADGATDDKTEIDFVNTSGEVVDLGGKSYEYNGTFTEAATFINGSIIDDDRTYDYGVKTNESTVQVIQQNLPFIKYHSTTQWRLEGVPDKWVMSGMRLLGQWQNTSGVTKLSGASSNDVIITRDTALEFLTSHQSDTWYGIIAIANDEDTTVTYKLVPYLRAYSVAGSVITLGEGGWNQASATMVTETLNTTTDSMAGRDAIVIGEGGEWSGRTLSITANTTTTVTVDTIGSIATLDYLLPIPEADYFVYLGSVYIEGSEPKNLAYTAGGRVNSHVSSLSMIRATGAYDPQEEIEIAGHVPPTATAAIMGFNCAINSATAGGDVAQYFYHDSSSHLLMQTYDFNAGITGWPLYYEANEIVFSSARKSIYYKTAGSHDGSISGRQWTVRGWIEP